MDEEEKKPEGEEETTADSTEGSKPETTPLIEQANTASERLEAANEKKEELLAREEKLEADKRLGGRAEAGRKPEVKKKLDDKEYFEALEKGEVNLNEDDGR